MEKISQHQPNHAYLRRGRALRNVSGSVGKGRETNPKEHQADGEFHRSAGIEHPLPYSAEGCGQRDDEKRIKHLEPRCCYFSFHSSELTLHLPNTKSPDHCKTQCSKKYGYRIFGKHFLRQ